MTAPVKVFTMPQVAQKLGIHRTTLKRFEDRGLIPPARWVTTPFRARVYTEEDFALVEVAVRNYMQRYSSADGDGITVDPKFIVTAEEAKVDPVEDSRNGTE